MKPKWISANHSLPHLGEMVLVCERGEVTTIACRATKEHGVDAGKEVWRVKENCFGYEMEPLPCHPEYWMPLPIPPI